MRVDQVSFGVRFNDTFRCRALIGFFSFFEFYADMLVSWLPLYYEVKILFLLWLVSPTSRGTPIIWSQYLKPFLNSREVAIDATIDETKSKIFSHVEQAKSKALNAVSLNAQYYLENSKNPVLMALAPMVASITQPTNLIEEEKGTHNKVFELPDESFTAPSTACKPAASAFDSPLSAGSPKTSRLADSPKAISSPGKGSPLRDRTNGQRSPNSSPPGVVALVPKPRKAQIPAVKGVVKRSKVSQELENLKSQPMASNAVTKRKVAAGTGVQTRNRIGSSLEN